MKRNKQTNHNALVSSYIPETVIWPNLGDATKTKDAGDASTSLLFGAQFAIMTTSIPVKKSPEEMLSLNVNDSKVKVSDILASS